VNRYLPTIAAIWLGMIIAISFMEAPLKFQAPSVTLSIGLEIGRIIFSTLNRIEWVLMITLLGIIIFNKSNRHHQWMIGVLVLILITQTAYLLPLLDQRASLIIIGEIVPKNNAHLYYVAVEIIKSLVLMLLSFLPSNVNA
jgi:hypothetical protein